ASLIVRNSNWHAVSQLLKVQAEDGIREYELSEMDYEVVPLQALTVFTDGASAPTPSLTLSPTPAHDSSSSPAADLPSEMALREAEAAAFYALHQLQADLSGQIEVRRDSVGHIVAQGLVETTERKQQLTDALSRIPLVIAQLQTIDEAARRKPA